MAAQLGITEPERLASYLARPTTHREHVGEIKRLYGYRDFTDQPEHFRLVRWLYTRAWLSAERPSVLFDLATARLVEQKVLLPGVSVLARLVAQVRDRAATRLWQTLSQTPDAEQRARLESLLEVPTPAPANAGAGSAVGAVVANVDGRADGRADGRSRGAGSAGSARQTPFDRLRRAPPM